MATHFDTSKHREFQNYHQNPTVCETGDTVGRDAVAINVLPNLASQPNSLSTPLTGNGQQGVCPDFTSFHSGSLTWAFPGDDVHAAYRNYDQVPHPGVGLVHHRVAQRQGRVGRFLDARGGEK